MGPNFVDTGSDGTEIAALVDRLRALGVELVPVGDRLRFRPADALTPEDLEALRQHKYEVIAFLTPKAASAYAHPWPDSIPGLGRRAVGAFDPCSAPACERWSWVRYAERVLCFAHATGQR